MNDNFSNSQLFRKPALVSDKGIVSAQHRVAAEVGAGILAKGGDCIDAAVATSFALGALEPWMSGIGGIGTMVVYRSAEKRFEVIDFGGLSPAALRPADYPLSGDGKAADLFPWARVTGDRNLHGPGSIAVPGVVAGMDTAHRRYGTLDWQELVSPAAALARQGLLVDWYTTECIATGAPELRLYPAAAEDFLRDGLPPTAMWGIKSEVRLPRPRYANSLELIARQGAKVMYGGELGADIARDVRAAGGCLDASDFASYQARVLQTLPIPYRGAIIHATPELTAGPTLARTLKNLSDRAMSSSKPGAQDYLAYGRALQEAYLQRLSDMGDHDGQRAVGAEHLQPSCTTHFNVVDRNGNMVAVTQTLLGIFGSKFVTPNTGVLMNNGIMWFDPEPGKANSLAAGKRCLSNYTPVIADLGGGRMMAVGASGGRRILPAVAQLISFAADFGMNLDQVFETPRLDASEGPILIGDTRMDAATHSLLAANFDYEIARRQTMPFKFACPSAVMREGSTNSGASEVVAPWADAVAG